MKHTPDTEWEKEFDAKFPSVESWSQRNGDYTEAPIPRIKAFIAKYLTSRDTYWKEKYEALHEKHTDEAYQLGKMHQKELVRKEVERMKPNKGELTVFDNKDIVMQKRDKQVFACGYQQAKIDLLQALDNLK